MELAEKKLFCRIVGQLIVADAEVTDAEHEFLERLMTRFELGEADKEALVDGISTALSIDEAVAQLGTEAKAHLLDELVAVATVDGVLASAEAKMIQAVRDALGAG